MSYNPQPEQPAKYIPIRMKSIQNILELLKHRQLKNSNEIYRQTSNISPTQSAISLRCSWSIAYRRCSNNIFILDLTPGFNGLGKDNCKARRETFELGDLMRLILEVWRYVNTVLRYMASNSGGWE